jgi:beta-lactamase regulating signal transducer with metallopeptidase domain
MGNELYSIYAFNVIFNSALSFFTTLILVELILHLFRIKNPRGKAVAYTLPFCKICVDLFLYHFSNWALLDGVNPLLAQEGTRNLSIVINPFTQIQFSLLDGKTFTLADILALSMSSLLLKTLVCIAILGTLVALSHRLIHLFQAKGRIKLVLSDASFIDLPNINPSLAFLMKEKGIKCALSSEACAPCIIKNTIVFPKSFMDELSQQEIEAIISHEIAHFHWKDSGLRVSYSLIASIFWWIPTNWLQKRIQELQEQAADLMIHKFGISKFALAEAVLKTARKSAQLPPQLSCSFAQNRLSLTSRIKMILQEPVKKTLKWEAIQYGFLGLILISILFGKIWIF